MTRWQDQTHFHGDYAPRQHSHGKYVLATDVALSAGVATVPTLGAGASATVSVALARAMADATFTATAFLTGQGITLLGNLVIQSWNVTSAEVVDVVVKNTGLVSIATGANLVVIAIRT